MVMAALFPGQGAQHLGMGKNLYEADGDVKTLYHLASEIVGLDLAMLCFDGPEEKLASTIYQQPAILVTSMAHLIVLKKKAPHVVRDIRFAMGLSLGEYTACAFSGALDDATAISLVYQRGKYMQEASEAVPSGMKSLIGATREQAEAICASIQDKGVIQVANINAPGQIVLSGTLDALACVEASAKAAGIGKVIALKVSGAFHSEIMAPARDKLAVHIRRVRFQKPRMPVISNVTAEPTTDPQTIRDHLIQQMCKPVRWEDAIRCAIARHCNAFLEIGPGAALTNMMKRIDRQAAAYATHKGDFVSPVQEDT